MCTLTHLSPAQREVALAADGPLAVIAGPGSGKTATLAARVAHLVLTHRREPPGVLALTFTGAAAHALRARLADLLGTKATIVEVSTFHAFGLRVVQRWWSDLGCGPGPPIVYGAAAARATLLEAMRAAGLASAPGERPDTVRVLREFGTAVERARLADSVSSAAEPVSTIAGSYEALLRERNAVDYPAMLALPLRLFRERPATLRRYQAVYRHILVDEAQDMCAAQYALVRLLAAEHRNLTLVGDPRQALFGWRGADPRFLLDLPRQFPGARVITLSQNFRSTVRILDLANALGAALSYGDRLWTANLPGVPPAFYVARDERDEAAFVASEITRLLHAGLVEHAGQIAILCRTNGQVRLLAQTLAARGLAPRDGDTTGHVRVGTIHGAKGREWRVVFVTGVEEDLLPHVQATRTACPGAINAERQVAYVAVTRPRDRLYLTCCERRTDGETLRPCRPSRFLTALPADLVTRVA